MTDSEAIGYLKTLKNRIPLKFFTNDGAKRYDEFCEKSISALEKQKPKKPIMKQYFDDMEEEYLCCPTCGEILTDRMPMDNKDFYFHCLNCGQKLNWESD